MKMRGFVFFCILVFEFVFSSGRRADSSALRNEPLQIRTDQFKSLMQTVAEGWNEGDARKSADCFAESAVYTEPPDKQLYIGRKSLYEFFGGDKKPEPPMGMVWHHLAFDESQQIGFGEYTFQMNSRYHGIVIVKIENEKIRNWRECQYQSTLDWKLFRSGNEF